MENMSPGSQRGAIHPPVRENAIPERPAMRPAMRRPGSMDGVVRVPKSDVTPVVAPVLTPVLAPTPAPVPTPPFTPVPINDIVKPATTTTQPPATTPVSSDVTTLVSSDAKPEAPAAPVAPLTPTSFGSNTPLNRNKWLLIGGAVIVIIIIGVVTFSIL